MVLLLGVVIIVLSEGVKDTTALDGGVIINILRVMQCVQSLSRLPADSGKNTTAATVIRRVCTFLLSTHL